jgi:hypothetical protein
MAQTSKTPKTHTIEVVEWNGHPHCVYVNDYRVAGSKPWGGGKTVLKLDLDIKSLIEAIPDLPAVVAQYEKDRLALIAERASVSEGMEPAS